jgi:hypothetical protein
VHAGLGLLVQEGRKCYGHKASGNLQTVTGSGVTETYGYTNTNQPDELTSYGVTGRPTLSFFYDSNGSRPLGSGSTATNSGGLPTGISTNPNASQVCQAGVQDPTST